MQDTTIQYKGEDVTMYAKDIEFCAGKYMSAQGQFYRILKMPFKYTINGEFMSDGIYVPDEISVSAMNFFRLLFSKENTGQYERPAGEQYRANVDKWLGRLVFKGNEPMSIEKCCNDNWTDDDFIKCFQIMVKCLG